MDKNSINPQLTIPPINNAIAISIAEIFIVYFQFVYFAIMIIVAKHGIYSIVTRLNTII